MYFLKFDIGGFHIMKKWNSKSVGLCNNKILQLNETFLLQTTKNLQKVIIKHSKVISKGESFSDEPQSQMKWNLIWSLVVERTNLGFQFCFHDLSIATSAWIKICPVLITYLSPALSSSKLATLDKAGIPICSNDTIIKSCAIEISEILGLVEKCHIGITLLYIWSTLKEAKFYQCYRQK